MFGEGCNGRRKPDKVSRSAISYDHSSVPPFLSYYFLLFPHLLSVYLCLSHYLYVWSIFYSFSFPISALPARHEVIVIIPIPIHSEGLMQLNEMQGGRKKGHLAKFSVNPIKDYAPKHISSQHYSLLHQHSGKHFLNHKIDFLANRDTVSYFIIYHYYGTIVMLLFCFFE